MKLKKWNVPAHREFYLVCESRGYTYYDGCCYRSQEAAQKRADAFNARRDTAKHGSITVAWKDRPAAIVSGFTVRL